MIKIAQAAPTFLLLVVLLFIQLKIYLFWWQNLVLIFKCLEDSSPEKHMDHIWENFNRFKHGKKKITCLNRLGQNLKSRQEVIWSLIWFIIVHQGKATNRSKILSRKMNIQILCFVHHILLAVTALQQSEYKSHLSTDFLYFPHCLFIFPNSPDTAQDVV